METKSFRNSLARSWVTRSRARLNPIGTAKTRHATGKLTDHRTGDRHPELTAWITHQALHHQHSGQRPDLLWTGLPAAHESLSGDPGWVGFAGQCPASHTLILCQASATARSSWRTGVWRGDSGVNSMAESK